MNKNNPTKELRNSIEWLENVLTVKTKIPGQTYTFYEVRPQLEEILKQLKELENLRNEANNFRKEIHRMEAFNRAENDGARDDW